MCIEVIKDDGYGLRSIYWVDERIETQRERKEQDRPTNKFIVIAILAWSSRDKMRYLSIEMPHPGWAADRVATIKRFYLDNASDRRLIL